MVKKRQYISFEPAQLKRVDDLVPRMGFIDRAALVRMAVAEFLEKHKDR